MTSKKNFVEYQCWIFHKVCGAWHKTYYTCECTQYTHSNSNLFKHNTERQTERESERKNTCSKYSTPKWNLPELCLNTYLRIHIWHGKFMKINPISALHHTHTHIQKHKQTHNLSERKKISNKFSSLFAILHAMCFADITIFIVNWFFCISHAQHFASAAATAVDVDYNV